jgi:hypothetical protein
MSIPHRRAAIPWWGHLLQPWFLAMLFIGWYLWHVPSQWQYDSRELYRGCRNILDWFEGHAAMDHPRPFSLFQYPSGIAALWAVEHGFNFNIYVFWAVCSQLSFGAILLMFHVIAHRLHRPALGWAAMLVMLSGPLLMYANSTFNEMVAAFLTLSFAAAAMGEGGPLVCAILFWFSGITKETAVAMLAVIWLGAMWIRQSRLRRRQLVMHSIALLAATVLTIATNGGFNGLRYGTIWNAEYLQPQSLVHFWSWRFQYIIALWLSPNGGLLAFWPTLVITMIALIAEALREQESLMPMVIVTIVLAGETLGLSGWWQPFGWYAWGPRLILPWLPACLLILLRGYPEACTRLVNRCVRERWALTTTTAIVCLCALPHITAAAHPEIILPFFASDSQFPHGVSPAIPQDEYAQNIYFAWRKMPPMLLRPIIGTLTGLQISLTVCFQWALVTLLRRCGQVLRRSPNPGYSQSRNA